MNGRVPDPASLEAIEAAVETILPGDETTASGPSLGVTRHVVELCEQYLPGFPDVIAALLNAYAAEQAGVAFAALDDAGRRDVLRAMSAEDSVDVRDAADALFVFSYGGMYSEWSGFDKRRRVLRAPDVWPAIGFPGPALGHPDFGPNEHDGPHPDVKELTP